MTQQKMSAGKQGGAKPRRSPGRPKLEDVAAIESRLVSVALSEFLAHGYGGASLTKIVKAAGASKTTLYSRFSSKEELFRAIMQQQIERLDAPAALRTRAGRPELEKGLKAYANHMLELSLQGDFLDVNRLVYSESHRFPELGATAAERTELGVKRISAFIRECARADDIPCKDPEGVAEAFILMIRGWYVNVMLTNRKVSAAQRERWVERAVRTLLSARADW
jgi:AcrR family transcriptional regulator